MKKTFDELNYDKFKDELDVCLGNFDEDLSKTLEQEFAVHKWDYTHFMNEKELSKLKQGDRPSAIKAPKYFDLS